VPLESGEDPQAKRSKEKDMGSTLPVGAAAVIAADIAQCKGVRPNASDEEFAAWAAASLASTAAIQVAAASAAESGKPASEGETPSGEAGETDEVFKYTGPLRPARVTPQMAPPEGCFAMPDYALHPKGVPRSEFLRSNRRTIPVLTGQDLEMMREACRLGREVLDIASRFMRVGITGDEIDRIVYQACKDRGLYPSPLNYSAFPKSVCVSANELICHGIPDCRPIEDGDIVNLDISIYYRGFHSDLNETFFVGACDEDSHALVRTAYEALRAASAFIRPGTMYRELGAKIQAVAEQHGCTVAPTYCGHGVGKLFHGPPDIPHYRKNKAVGVMKPGHVFTVEPMLNWGVGGKDVTWPDGWSAATKSGRRSAQFEHSFLVTEEGFEILTARPGTDPTAMPPFEPSAFQR